MTQGQKDICQYGSAVAMLTSGVAMAFLSFAELGSVHDSVLWYVAQTLIYAGSIFGVSMVITSKFGEIRNYLQDHDQRTTQQQPGQPAQEC